MVLDAGRIVSLFGCNSHIACVYPCVRQVEFGKPSELLQLEQGKLRALVDESADREKLYAMATGASAST